MNTTSSELSSRRGENSYIFNYDSDSDHDKYSDDDIDSNVGLAYTDKLTESLNNLQSAILEYNTIVNQVLVKKDILDRTLNNSPPDSNIIVYKEILDASITILSLNPFRTAF